MKGKPGGQAHAFGGDDGGIVGYHWLAAMSLMVVVAPNVLKRRQWMWCL